LVKEREELAKVDVKKVEVTCLEEEFRSNLPPALPLK